MVSKDNLLSIIESNKEEISSSEASANKAWEQLEQYQRQYKVCTTCDKTKLETDLKQLENDRTTLEKNKNKLEREYQNKIKGHKIYVIFAVIYSIIVTFLLGKYEPTFNADFKSLCEDLKNLAMMVYHKALEVGTWASEWIIDLTAVHNILWFLGVAIVIILTAVFFIAIIWFLLALFISEFENRPNLYMCVSLALLAYTISHATYIKSIIPLNSALTLIAFNVLYVIFWKGIDWWKLNH